MKLKMIAVFAATLIASSVALAAPKSSSKGSDSITSSSSAAAKGSSSGLKFGAGLTSMGVSGISGLIELDDKMSVQVLVGMTAGTVAGTTSVGAGGMFRYTLCGSRDLGFHVGGGVLMGSRAGGFYADIAAPDVGLHLTLVEKVRLSFDGGLLFSPAQGPSFTFGAGSFGALLGASVHYMF